MLSTAFFPLGFSAPTNHVEEPNVPSDHWAVLIAGSSGYGNYRHQADVCHAYQLLTKKGGIPAEKVITIAVDDVANNDMNPFPGKMFNAPTPDGVAGIDVYKDCKIDYNGLMVTPDTLVKVLTGDSAGLNGGKVLKSGSNSRVFVNFVDHGGVDIIGFPRTTMHSKQLIAALQTMHDKQMYKVRVCPCARVPVCPCARVPVPVLSVPVCPCACAPTTLPVCPCDRVQPPTILLF